MAYLAGITIIGKGPTYIGVPPVFWGEVVMLLGLLMIAPWCRPGKLFQGENGWMNGLVVVWMAIGACLTVTSLPQWGLDAVRDAAIWYYALFYFIGLGLSARVEVADRFWKILGIFWMLALLWGSADLATGKHLSEMGPVIPWRGVPLLFNARDESGQNLALGAIIVLCTGRLARRPMWRVFMGTFAIAGLALLASSEGRAVKLGLASAMLILFAFSFAPGKIALAKRTRLLIVAAIPAAVVLIMLVPDLSKKMQLDRFSGAAPSEADGTAYWRLIWWQRLEKEVMTRNPAFGLGFGESLHLYHPALEKISDPWMLRAPHNFNVTVFTRMGIVGTIVWAGIILGGLAVLGRRIWRGRVKHGRYSPQRREELLFWMAMIAYTFVNSSFGVLMEGPVLGIWFWLALGFAYGRSERPDVPERQAALAELRRELKRFMNARGRFRTPSVPREEHAPLRAVPGGEF